jgi:subtilase family serine protease
MIRRLSIIFPAIVAMVLAMVLGLNVVCQAQERSLLTRHVREVTSNGQAQSLGLLPSTQVMRFDIVLGLHNQAELERFLREVNDPSSRTYRHFLTVPQFTKRFGPTQKEYAAVIRFAKTSGFTVIGGSRDGMDVQLKGSVADIETAFHVTIGVYQHPTENRTFYAPDREPTVDLPFQLWHISGLDNYSIPHSALLHRDLNVESDAGVTPETSTGTCPSISYCGSDMRAAYYGGTALTGSGQTLGLLEYYGYDQADVNTYFTNAGQTNNVPVTGISTDGTNVSCLAAQGCDDTEQTLDITQAVSIAPGMTALYVYVGSSDTAIFSSMSTHLSKNGKLDAQLSSSWTWMPSDPGTDDPYFEKFAAHGQNLFQAAGDSGKYTSSSTYVYPANDAHVTSVGGTDLQTSGPGGAWVAETVWYRGGGGYYTPDAISIPSWQQLTSVITPANQGSTTLRNSPDVAAESNFDFYVCANQSGCTANYWGGTSFAAPMWAGYMALVNQQAVANGNSTVGFINPIIYSLGLGSGYGTDFHDIISGSNGYSAVTGYDLATGWGSPNGTGLINALAGTAASPDFTISASPSSRTVAPGGSTSYTVTIGALRGYTGTVTPSVTGLDPLS